MAWTDVNFDEVKTTADLLPKGDYTFMVLGASRGKFDADEISVKLSVMNEGSFIGQTVYARYPNPEKAGKGVPANDPRNWVNKAWKVFEIAIGGGQGRGEHPVDFVTRKVNEAASQKAQIIVNGRIDHETFPDKETGETVTRHKVVLRSFTPFSTEDQAA